MLSCIAVLSNAHARAEKSAAFAEPTRLGRQDAFSFADSRHRATLSHSPHSATPCPPQTAQRPPSRLRLRPCVHPVPRRLGAWGARPGHGSLIPAVRHKPAAATRICLRCSRCLPSAGSAPLSRRALRSSAARVPCACAPNAPELRDEREKKSAVANPPLGGPVIPSRAPELALALGEKPVYVHCGGGSCMRAAGGGRLARATSRPALSVKQRCTRGAPAHDCGR